MKSRWQVAAGVVASLIAAIGASSAPGEDSSGFAVRCAPIGVCFCVNHEFDSLINANVSRLRRDLAVARSSGKLTIYISTPLSTKGGSHFAVNAAAADATKKALATRFGTDRVYILNPADVSMRIGDKNAGQGDYMLLWALVLGGERGLAEDFDAVYFMGPSDYASTLHLTGTDDLVQLGKEFDRLLSENVKFADDVRNKRLTKESFLVYYGLRASAAFSAGARDEWNIARLANARRRDKDGAAGQVAVFFDGHAVDTGDYEDGVTPGNAWTGSVGCSPSS